MSEYSPRYSSIQMLQENWPRQYPQSRLKFVARRLAKVPDDVVIEAMSHMVDTMEWPPTIRAILTHCRVVMNRKASRKRVDEDLRPGGYNRHGDHFMTIDEAKIELERMRSEHPEAFLPDKKFHGRGIRVDIERTVDRIWVKSLRRCIAWDKSTVYDESGQGRMF